MFSILQAPVIASKGHFYQIDEDAMTKHAVIYKKNTTTVIDPIPEEDDTFLGMEQHSGVNIQARQRLQLNFYIERETEKAGLFNFLQNNYTIVPLTFVKRESIMTKQNVKDILGALYIAKTARTAGLATLIVLGVLLLGLAIFMFVRLKKVRREEEFGIFDTKKAKGNENDSLTQSYKAGNVNATYNENTLLGNSTVRGE